MRLLLLLAFCTSCCAFTGPGLGLPLAKTRAPSIAHVHILSEPRTRCIVKPRPLQLFASTGPDPMSVTSALVAFGHYGSFLGAFGLLAAERVLVKEDLTAEEATKLSFLDAGYGIAGLGVLGTGYLRATKYAKGWGLYAHSPFFYGKMLALGVMAGLSLYPTITFIKWAIFAAGQQDKSIPLPCLEDRVIKRLRFFTQHELYAFLCIPFCAAMMARGIGYNESIPMWAMAMGAIVPTVGASAYSVKAALADTKAWEEQLSLLGNTEQTTSDA